MSLITRMRRQTAVYWPPSTIDDFGDPKQDVIFGDPVELTPSNGTGVRWEDVQTEFLDKDARTVISSAVVYFGQYQTLDGVKHDLSEGGVLWLGALQDVEPLDPSPFANEGAAEIAKISKVPNIRATEILRRAYLGVSGVHHGSAQRSSG